MEGAELLVAANDRDFLIARPCNKTTVMVVASVLAIICLVNLYMFREEVDAQYGVLLAHLLVQRADWNALPPNVTLQQLEYPTKKILILPTNTSILHRNEHSCKQLMKRLQIEHMVEDHEPDILYNFVVCDEGRVYEGRGWTKRSVIRNIPAISESESVYVIGVEGTFTETAPELYQINGVKAFIAGAIVTKHLSPAYRVIIGSPFDEPFAEISKHMFRKRFQTDNELKNEIYS